MPFPDVYVVLAEQFNRTVTSPGTRADARVVNRMRDWIHAAQVFYGITTDPADPAGSLVGRVKALEATTPARITSAAVAPSTPLPLDIWINTSLDNPLAQQWNGTVWRILGANANALIGKAVQTGLPADGQGIAYDATSGTWLFSDMGFLNPMNAKAQVIGGAVAGAPAIVTAAIPGQVLTANDPTTATGLAFDWPKLRGLTLEPLARPVIASVTPQGATGGQTWSYYVVAEDHRGRRTIPSLVGQTFTGSSTLTSTNFVRVTWAAVPGAKKYYVLKNNTSTLLGSVDAPTLTYDDTGAATSSFTPLARNETADLLLPGNAIQTDGAYESGLATAPDVSPPNRGRIYYDGVTNKWMRSSNGTAYVELGGQLVFRDEGGTGVSAGIVDFVGAGVTTSLAGGVLTVNIPGGGGGGAGTVEAQDEATAAFTATRFTFLGAGVSVVNSAGIAQVTIPGGFAARDEGVALGNAYTVDFVGAGVATSLVGTTLTVNISGGGGGGGSGVEVQDEGGTAELATRLNFVGLGVTTAVVAGVATVNVSGGVSNPLTSQYDLIVGGVPSGGVAPWNRFGFAIANDLVLSRTADAMAWVYPSLLVQVNGGFPSRVLAIDITTPGASMNVVDDIAFVTLPSSGDATSIQGEAVSATAPSEGDTFVYTGGLWVPQPPAGGGGGGAGFYPTWGNTRTIPTLLTFPNTRNGGAGVVATAHDEGVRLQIPPDVTNNWRQQALTAPAAPFTRVFEIYGHHPPGQYSQCGAGVRRTANNAFYFMGVQKSNTATEAMSQQWSSFSAFSNQTWPASTHIELSHFWVEVEGTTAIATWRSRISVDGRNWGPWVTWNLGNLGASDLTGLELFFGANVTVSVDWSMEVNCLSYS